MMKILCDKCGKTLKEQGALIFSPPKGLSVGGVVGIEGGLTCSIVRKIHICKDCFVKLLKWVYKYKKVGRYGRQRPEGR